MTRFLTVLAFALACAVSAQGEQSASPDTGAVFELLRHGAEVSNTETKRKPPELVKGTPEQVHAFLKSYPIAADRVIDNVSFNRAYRFVQAYYSNYYVVFDFGAGDNRWKDKLYGMSFSIVHKGEKIPEDQTRVYRRMVQLYGNPTGVRKFMHGNLTYDDDLNCALWIFPESVLTYRAPYFAETRETVAVVEFMDKSIADQALAMPGCWYKPAS